MKEKLAFINIPDATQKEVTQLAQELHKLIESKIQLPYRLVIFGGREWKTISKDEIIKLLEKLPDE